jgi:hypothetical protein
LIPGDDAAAAEEDAHRDGNTARVLGIASADRGSGLRQRDHGADPRGNAHRFRVAAYRPRGMPRRGSGSPPALRGQRRRCWERTSRDRGLPLLPVGERDAHRGLSPRPPGAGRWAGASTPRSRGKAPHPRGGASRARERSPGLRERRLVAGNAHPEGSIARLDGAAPVAAWEVGDQIAVHAALWSRSVSRLEGRRQ